MDLKDKHILVTGASSGIGRACAIRFAEEGATVSLLARNQERLEQTRQAMCGDGHGVYSFDLCRVEEIEEQLAQIVRERGKLDGIMYCAGDCYIYPLSMCKPDILQKSMQTAYFSFVELLRCAAKKKMSNDGASFASMTSDASLKGEKILLTLSASKAAMNMAVRCAAHELASRRIRVNAIAASYIDGSIMVGKTIEAMGKAQVEKLIAEQQPLGWGHPEDIANAAAFLMSDGARFITGSIITVDGGFMA